MNVLTESTIVIATPHARIMMVHLIALVILGIQEMGLIVKVSSGYFNRCYVKHCKTHIAGI